MLEDGGNLILSAGSHAGVAAGMVQVVGGQLGDVERQVLFRREDVIGLAVVVDVERHVACHLSRGEVAFRHESLFHGLAPRRRPPILEVSFVERISQSDVLFAELHRPCAGIGSRRIEEFVRSFGTVGHGHTIAGGVVALPLQFQVEPHAELFRHGVVDDFRAFQDAAALNVGARRCAAHTSPALPVLSRCRLGDAQCDAAVAPVDQIL